MKRNHTPTLRRGLSILVIATLLAGLAVGTAPPQAAPIRKVWHRRWPHPR